MEKATGCQFVCSIIWSSGNCIQIVTCQQEHESVTRACCASNWPRSLTGKWSMFSMVQFCFTSNLSWSSRVSGIFCKVNTFSGPSYIMRVAIPEWQFTKWLVRGLKWYEHLLTFLVMDVMPEMMILDRHEFEDSMQFFSTACTVITLRSTP